MRLRALVACVVLLTGRPAVAGDPPPVDPAPESTPSDGEPRELFFVGITGAWPRKHAPISVPPEMLMTGHRPPPTTSLNHLYGSGFHGSPVEARILSLDRS